MAAGVKPFNRLFPHKSPGLAIRGFQIHHADPQSSLSEQCHLMLAWREQLQGSADYREAIQMTLRTQSFEARRRFQLASFSAERKPIVRWTRRYGRDSCG